MSFRLLPGYYEMPVVSGSASAIRLLRMECTETLSELGSAALSSYPITDSMNASVECSMFAAANVFKMPMGSPSFGQHSICEGYSSGTPVLTLDSQIDIFHTGAVASVTIGKSSISGVNRFGGYLGYTSGLEAQISLPVVIKTADNRYIVDTIQRNYSSVRDDVYAAVNRDTSIVLPSSGTQGYFVGLIDVLWYGTPPNYPQLLYIKNVANQLLGLAQGAVDLETYILGLQPVEPSTDPYEPGGYSGTGGGGGGQNFSSDAIGFAPLPTLSFADTGFCRIYNPTLTQLQALASYMWTDTTFLQTVINHAKQLLENPMEAIISLSMVPVSVPQGSAETVKVLFISTGVSMAPVTNQFVEVDCGTLALPVEDQYGAALDFNPYTSIDLYLPYIGQVTIDIDEVMYKTMHCVYRVDVVTGMCVACISVLEGADGVAGETVLYQFAGHCGIQMPLTSADFSGYVGAIIGATKMVAGLAAAGAGAPGIAAGIIGAPSPQTSRTSSVTTENGGGATWSNYATTRNPKTGRQITAATSGGESTVKPRVTARETTHTTDPPSFGELAMRGAVNTVDGVMGGKMHVEHSGGFTGTSGYIAGVRRPYAIIKHPNQCYPENYSSYKGFPAMIYMSLGDCEGYTEVHDVQINGMSATNPELGELAELLKTGVIF